MDHESDKIERLEERIDQLEAVTKKMMPSRRDALKLGGAAAIGAATMSGTALAGSNQVGTIGDPNNLVDIEAEDVTINDTLNGASISGAAQDEALLSDGAGGLTFGGAGGGLPSNFTYNDIKNTRAMSQNFTNNTGKALFVIVIAELSSDNDRFNLRFEVDGQVVDFIDLDHTTPEFTSNTQVRVSAFVPNGSIYRVTAFIASNIVHWYEIEF